MCVCIERERERERECERERDRALVRGHMLSTFGTCAGSQLLAWVETERAREREREREKERKREREKERKRERDVRWVGRLWLDGSMCGGL